MTTTTNAAYHLAHALRGYATPSHKPPEATRGFRGGVNDLDAWRRHSDAADLVKTIDHTLQGMDASGENVDMFMLALPRWYAGVHFATIPWGKVANGNGIRPACAEGDINLLEALGLVIKTGKPITLDEDDRRTLSDVLAEARTLVESNSDDLPDDVRHYLWALILRAEKIVSNLDDYSTEAVRQVALELGGALIVQADHAEARGDKPQSSRWRSAGHMLIGGFLAKAGDRGAEAAIEGAVHVAKAIGGS